MRVGGALARLLLAASALLPSGCTTVSNDPTTSSKAAFFGTQIDFQPPSLAERVRQVQGEKMFLGAKLAPLDSKLAGLEGKREALYQELAEQFPACNKQRHCLSSVTKGDIKRFEKYREALGAISALDSQAAELEGEKLKWQRRHDLRVRAIYNRYLITELQQAPKFDPRLRQVRVHSLEAYPDRLSLSRRLLALADPDLTPTLMGDLDFRMLGRPVDEAAALVTLDIHLQRGGRYLVTLLVNTHQVDAVQYGRGFIEGWSRRLADEEQLRFDAFCGLYSLAGDILVTRLSLGKTKPCADARSAARRVTLEKYEDRMSPAAWVVPVAYTPIPDAFSSIGK